MENSDLRKICVIDGNALMHRAFHAISTSLRSSDGTPTNAVFGFFNMFCKFVSELKPDVTLCTFDHGKATHRLELFGDYKANRPKMDDDLRVQFPVVEEVLHSMDVPIIVEEGWEGDDVMGTISKMCSDNNLTCYLVTGDKDMNQLVANNIFTVTTDRKAKDVIIRDSEAVKARFGVRPDQIIDYLAIVGDHADNIPGVEGIGEKGAAQLLEKYGTLDKIYENLSDFKGKRLENLINHKDDAYLSQKLATINTELNLDLDLNSIQSFNYDENALNETLEQFELRATAASFKKMMNVLKLNESDNLETSDNLAIPDFIDFDEARKLIEKAILDGESVGASLVFPTKAYLKKHPEGSDTVGISTDKLITCTSCDEARSLIELSLKKSLLVAYDVKEVAELAYPHDSSVVSNLTEEEMLHAKTFDVHVCSNMLDSYKTFRTQEEFFSSLNRAYSVDDDICKRASEFAYLSLFEKGEQEKKLEADPPLKKLFFELEVPLTNVLSIIERNGCRLNDDTLRNLKDLCDEQISELSEKIFDLAGHDFKIESPAQLSIVLFQEMGIKPLKKNKSGYSTDAKVLKELSEEHEICNFVIKHRELSKLKSTYIEALPKIRLSDNLVHTKFNQAVTATGRLSSSDPNLQNIPVRTDLGRKIREAFVPLNDGELFMSADYSQIELRLLAHLSEDEHLIDAFQSGRDFHTQTASRIFGVSESEVTSAMRSKAKAVNFGIIYGQQAFSLSKQLGVSYGEAKDIIDRYYYSYPQVRVFLDTVVSDATRDGFAKTMFGRKRMIPELQSQNKQIQAFGQRTAMNHPMQGSAADIIKMAMIKLADEMVKRDLKSKILIQVHDELDLSVVEGEYEEVCALVKEIMENTTKLKVPLTVDISSGKNWSEAH